MNLKQIACVFFATMLCFSLVACSSSQIVTDLDLAAAAVATVANVPTLPTTITDALNDTASALDCVAAAVQTGGTNAQVAVAASACGLTAFKPLVPAGTPQTVVTLLQAVDDAIAKVIADQAQISVAMLREADPNHSIYETAFANKNAPQGGKTFNAGHSGKTKIATVRKNLAAAKAKLPKRSGAGRVL